MKSKIANQMKTNFVIDGSTKKIEEKRKLKWKWNLPIGLTVEPRSLCSSQPTTTLCQSPQRNCYFYHFSTWALIQRKVLTNNNFDSNNRPIDFLSIHACLGGCGCCCSCRRCRCCYHTSQYQLNGVWLVSWDKTTTTTNTLCMLL